MSASGGIPQEANSDMEFGMQDIDEGAPLGPAPQKREEGRRSGQREKVSCSVDPTTVLSKSTYPEALELK